MESVLLTPPYSCSTPNLFVSFRAQNVLINHGFSSKSNLDRAHFVFSSSQKLKSLVIVAAASKKDKNSKKVDTHSFVVKPDESAGLFPEAVLLKQKKVQEDGRLLPEFADAEEQELYEALNLLLESDLDVDRVRHYEVVYMIHEKYVDEVESVDLKVQEFLKERKGKVWRFSDWGLRRLAYKIQKAKNAHYILMNIELEAKDINDFKSMLDKDERVIRHLVIKRDEAITEDCPPPPEFHSMRAGADGEEEDDFYDVDYEEEDEEDDTGDELQASSVDNVQEDGIIYVDEDDGQENGTPINFGASTRRKKLKAQKVGR
ncbi:protein REGULATOR OF FATTY ACID COMPOSITION 3, chloroplastic [Apium graveolens]|uniref:protein REGULATOR OF FATTY ACID COMPOSITION 3, chloroplastic n=1 Tax=Apium graveolens TaxID=4045 RepID=UPI003D7A01A3